jgi:hypothetical protein
MGKNCQEDPISSQDVIERRFSKITTKYTAIDHGKMAVVDSNVRVHHSSIDPLILLCRLVSSKVQCDFAELFEGSFKIFDDFLGEHVGIGRVIGLFEAFVSEPEDVEARLSRLVALRNCKPANAIITVRI